LYSIGGQFFHCKLFFSLSVGFVGCAFSEQGLFASYVIHLLKFISLDFCSHFH